LVAEPELLSRHVALEGRLVKASGDVLALRFADGLEHFGEVGVVVARQGVLQLGAADLFAGSENAGPFGEEFEELVLLGGGEERWRFVQGGMGERGGWFVEWVIRGRVLRSGVRRRI
jgi:hypothetical protein